MPHIWGSWKGHFFSRNIKSKSSVQTLIYNSCMDSILWAGSLHDVQLLLLPKCAAIEHAVASRRLFSASEKQHQTILTYDSFRVLGGASFSLFFSVPHFPENSRRWYSSHENNRRSSLPLELLTRITFGRNLQEFKRMPVICTCWGYRYAWEKQ